MNNKKKPSPSTLAFEGTMDNDEELLSDAYQDALWREMAPDLEEDTVRFVRRDALETFAAVCLPRLPLGSKFTQDGVTWTKRSFSDFMAGDHWEADDFEGLSLRFRDACIYAESGFSNLRTPLEPGHDLKKPLWVLHPLPVGSTVTVLTDERVAVKVGRSADDWAWADRPKIKIPWLNDRYCYDRLWENNLAAPLPIIETIFVRSDESWVYEDDAGDEFTEDPGLPIRRLKIALFPTEWQVVWDAGPTVFCHHPELGVVEHTIKQFAELLGIEPQQIGDRGCTSEYILLTA